MCFIVGSFRRLPRTPAQQSSLPSYTVVNWKSSKEIVWKRQFVGFLPIKGEMDLMLYMIALSSSEMSIGTNPEMTNTASTKTVLNAEHTVKAVLLYTPLSLCAKQKT